VNGFSGLDGPPSGPSSIIDASFAAATGTGTDGLDAFALPDTLPPLPGLSAAAPSLVGLSAAGPSLVGLPGAGLMPMMMPPLFGAGLPPFMDPRPPPLGRMSPPPRDR